MSHQEDAERDHGVDRLPKHVRDALYAEAYGSNYAESAALVLLAHEARGASIVAFLNAERQKFERAHAEHIATRRSVVDYRRREYDDKTLRLDVQVTLINALLASIERGDDMGPR